MENAILFSYLAKITEMIKRETILGVYADRFVLFGSV